MDVTQWYARLSARLRERQKQMTLSNDGRAILWHAYRTFAMVMRDAADHDLIERAPARVRGAMRYVTKYEAPVLTVDQMWKLAERMPEYMRALVPLAVTTGPRSGELRGLRRMDVVALGRLPTQTPTGQNIHWTKGNDAWLVSLGKDLLDQVARQAA